jgi:hypothetical protein
MLLAQYFKDFVHRVEIPSLAAMPS